MLLFICRVESIIHPYYNPYKRKMIHHEIFTARAQPELNEKSFTPSEE
jgi:hypothetical protein